MPKTKPMQESCKFHDSPPDIFPWSGSEEPSNELAEQIALRYINQFVASTAKAGPQGEQTEAFHLLQCDGRWHGKFLAVYNNLDQCRTIMLEGLGDHGPNLIGRFSGEPK